MPGATPIHADDSALLHVLEAYIESLKAESEILKRRLTAAEARAARNREGRRSDRRVFGCHETADGVGG
jgi:hypothetical protein